MDNHIICCAWPNLKGITVYCDYLFVFETKINRITVILFFDLVSHCLIKMKCERLVLKISLHQFVDVWQYHKLNGIFNFSLTLTIMLCNRWVRKHSLYKLLLPLQELNDMLFLMTLRARMITTFHDYCSLDNVAPLLHLLMKKFWPQEEKVSSLIWI